jgi:uncharacterized protein with HEPN domain
MSFEPRDYLQHIAAEADYLLDRSTSLTFDTFSQDQTLRRAFVRSLEIIGEASKKVPEEFRARHPQVSCSVVSARPSTATGWRCKLLLPTAARPARDNLRISSD